MCIKCGGLIGRPGVVYGWGGTWCHCPVTPNTFSFPTYHPPTSKPCDHCYCEFAEDKSHKICCNCRNRQLRINVDGMS